MVSDLEQHPDVEIEDLWPAFLVSHPALLVPSPFTREVYNALAPTLGPWLMATQGLTVEMAQLGLESIWSVLVRLHGPAASSRFHALCAVLYTPCGRSVVAFEEAVGYASLLFHFPEILAALQPGGERPEVLAEMADVREAMARVQPWDLTRADGTHHVGVSLPDVVDYLSPLATLPACQAYWSWIRTEFAPAIARYGHYDPARGHAAPVGQELDILERREGARELLNDLLPGLGEETLAAGAEERTDG